jgi:hypothetical protein
MSLRTVFWLRSASQSLDDVGEAEASALNLCPNLDAMFMGGRYRSVPCIV